jgi:hypothetical protein
VFVPFAVTFRMPAIVRTPPRWLSGGSATFRNSRPSTPGIRTASRAARSGALKSDATKRVRLRSSFSSSSK